MNKNKLPFSKGFNFCGWLDARNTDSIKFENFTEQDFINIKGIGADTLRLPLNPHSMTGAAPDYRLDEKLFSFLDKAVDWAEKHKLYLILDNHSFHPVNPTETNIGDILIPVWRQFAERYKKRSSYLMYEILNEPHGEEIKKVWGDIQGKTIEEIRKIDKDHFIVAGGYDYNSITGLKALPNYNYENIIYTFHFYTPFLFTHQGETWSGAPTQREVRDIPFPFDVSRMPSMPEFYNKPASEQNPWVKNNYDNYSVEGTVKFMADQLDEAVEFSKQRGGIQLFCGEFGANRPNAIPEDRVRWYKTATELFSERGFAYTSWDYYGSFGIFKDRENRSFQNGLNTGMLKAMGFNVL